MSMSTCQLCDARQSVMFVHVNLHVITRPQFFIFDKIKYLSLFEYEVRGLFMSPPALKPMKRLLGKWHTQGIKTSRPFIFQNIVLKSARCTVRPGVVLAGSFPHTIAIGYPVEPDLVHTRHLKCVREVQIISCLERRY